MDLNKKGPNPSITITVKYFVSQVVEWVHKHLPDSEKKTQVGELLESKNYKLSHMPYDWGINS